MWLTTELDYLVVFLIVYCLFKCLYKVKLQNENNNLGFSKMSSRF